jgi:hypothetical protein
MANEQKHENSVTIVVNGRSKVVLTEELTFEEVVALAEGLPSGPNVIYTVVYRKGEDKKPQGTLVAGESVKVKNGMIFNVTATDKS